MLKIYVRPDSVQFVGKAWEIRQALRQEKKVRGAHTPLYELLPPRQRGNCKR